MKPELRWCADIGMYAFDRPINGPQGSCVHRTSFCNDTCYNIKLYRMYPNMTQRDLRAEAWWRQITGKEVAKLLKRKRRQITRVRFMTRGEALKDRSDVDRVKDICKENPGTTFWLPTRAWRQPALRHIIERELFPIKNLALNASLDPSNTDAEWSSLTKSGWSIMFFGDDSRITTPAGKRMFMCPKTHAKVKGHCATCKAGCFGLRTSFAKRTDVHLSTH